MGAGHCGSTLLDLILGSHSSGFSLAEFRVIPSLLDQTTQEIPRNVCVICGEHCEFWNERVSAADLRRFYSRSTLHHKLRSSLARRVGNPYDPLFAATHKTMLVDSSKTPGWFRRQLNPPRAWTKVAPRLIYLKRDGRAVINSYLRKYPERGIEVLTQKWAHSVDRMNRFFAEFPFPKKAIVHYEDLAQGPEASIKQICGFLDVPYEMEMLRYWAHDHHPIAGNGGTQSLILRFREGLGEISPEQRLRTNEGDRYYERKYYDDIGLAIRFDERWKHELTDEQIERFEQIAGTRNQDFIAPNRAQRLNRGL